MEHPAYMDRGRIDDIFMIFGSVRFFRYVNQGGETERLDVICIKSAERWISSLYLRGMKK